ANRRIPFADGLSSFTAVLTCLDLGLYDLIRRPALEAFLSSQLEFPTGGFRAAMWDEATDAEYTFYGLGLTALLPSLDDRP
ncbi:MAG: geranyl transferase, partial [Anaerolinea sp.]|nr:geranyl transferase [Anaerolinea sp.]